jgi:hypothetical protein
MITAQNIGLPQKWVQALNLAPRLGYDIIAETKPDMAYASSLQDALGLGVCAVHCVNGIPCAAFLHDPGLDREKVSHIHRALWNQGIADFLFVVHDDVLAIHSLWAPPLEQERTDGSPDPRLLESLSLINQSDLIADLLPKVESGRLFEDHSDELNHKTRVDARLISDLTAYRRSLTSAGVITLEQAHSALLQVMFLLYLWDRGIISDTHTRLYGGAEFTTLHNLLRGSLKGWQNLLSFLSKAFNGNMLLPDDNVWALGKDTLARFIEGEYDPATGQGRLLRLYDFKHIPVELISEVYDRFLESADAQKENGAYYTPRRLAGLVVDQAWPAIQACLDIGIAPRIMDPTCGSGVFLVTVFQRLANRLKGVAKQTDWFALKELVTNLHGTDTNSTAIQIAAFSLALALLNEREPREIEAELVGGNTILPPLLGNSLRQLDFFEVSADSKYNCILGNPPWGQQKGKAPSTGELWCKREKLHRPPNREKAWPFLWKAPQHLCEGGSLALLLPMKGCVYNSDADKCLKMLAKCAKLGSFVDLSDLRNTLFPGAKVPACIVHAMFVENGETLAYRYEHYCPKADYHSSKAGRILLAPEDRHQVWVQHLLASPGVLCRRLMWSSPGEDRLLAYLDTLPRVSSILLSTDIAREKFGDARPEWGIGLGFQRYTGKGKVEIIHELSQMPYLRSPDDLAPYVHPPFASEPHASEVLWRNFPEAFVAPHIVIVPSTAGRTGFRLRAAYSEFSFSYSKSMIGVTVPDTAAGRDTAKLLTAYLNSTFAGWYLYQTTNVGSDRERLSQYHTLLNLPFPEPVDLPDPGQAEQARAEIIRIMDVLLTGTGRLSGNVKRQLDTLVYRYFGVREDEITIIQEWLDEIRPAMHPCSRDFPKLWDNASIDDRKAYCSALSNTLSRKLETDNGVLAEVYDYTMELALVRISRDGRTLQRGPSALVESFPRQSTALGAFSNLKQKLASELSHNVYLERAVFFFLGDDAYLLKPMQRRFWLTRAALRDADRFVDYLLLPDPSPDDFQQ